MRITSVACTTLCSWRGHLNDAVAITLADSTQLFVRGRGEGGHCHWHHVPCPLLRQTSLTSGSSLYVLYLCHLCLRTNSPAHLLAVSPVLIGTAGFDIVHGCTTLEVDEWRWWRLFFARRRVHCRCGLHVHGGFEVFQSRRKTKFKATKHGFLLWLCSRVFLIPLGFPDLLVAVAPLAGLGASGFLCLFCPGRTTCRGSVRHRGPLTPRCP